jgi:hypothetical protein
MKLLLRLFARYAAVMGHVDGKNGYPAESDFLETPLYGVPSDEPLSSAEAQVLQIGESSALKEHRP